jgi:hypothetical protein
MDAELHGYTVFHRESQSVLVVHSKYTETMESQYRIPVGGVASITSEQFDEYHD